ESKSGKSAKPRTVSIPCEMTNEPVPGVIVHHNMYGDMVRSNCIVDLDTQAFQNVVFVNSVIRYKGGPVALINVTFINCWFDLQIPGSAPPISPDRDNLLLALLGPPDARRVKVSTRQ